MRQELWIVAGPNGGKTTWVQGALEEHEDLVYLSADQIAAELSPERPELAKIAAGREFLHRLVAGIARRESLVVESTLSGRGMRRFLDQARAAGYRIVIVFIFVDTVELCVARVAERVRKGGHDVPEEDIRRRYERSRERFWSLYRPMADRWHLYFNTREDFYKVALGTAGAGISILAPDLFEAFLPDGKL